MPLISLPNSALHISHTGTKTAAPVVFVHGLGQDHRIWTPVTKDLTEFRCVGVDLRGHGQSDVPNAPYNMGALVRDMEGVLDHLEIREAVVVGLGAGGLIAQALAVKRLDQVRALVLTGTATRLGFPSHWQARMDAIKKQGLTPEIAHQIPRWFSKSSLSEGWGDPVQIQLAATNPEGYLGVMAAISGTDMITPTSGLRLPTLVVAGTEDRAVPPDMQRDLAELIPGAEFHLLRGAGHLPPLDRPEEFSAKLRTFLKAIGHGARK